MLIKAKWSMIFGTKDAIKHNEEEFNKALCKVLDLLKNLGSVRRFKDREEVRKWCKQNYSTWEQGLTTDEKESIKLYTSCSLHFNNYLRQFRSSFIKDYIPHIDSSLEKAITPEKILAFRWINSEAFEDYLHSDGIYKGKKFKNRGYSSSTLLFNGEIQYSGDVLFILKIPKNYNGACLRNISNIPTEDEFLLKRNSTFTVEKVIYYTDKNAILICNVQ